MSDYLIKLNESGMGFTIAGAPPLAGRAAAAAPSGPPGTISVPSESGPLQSGQPAARPGGDFTFLFVMVGILVLMIFMSSMAGRKEKKRRAELLASVGRNDRIVTIGGLIGTVVDLRDDEIVLRVDDATNTRVTFSRSAVQGILKKRSDGRIEEPEAAGARG